MDLTQGVTALAHPEEAFDGVSFARFGFFQAALSAIKRFVLGWPAQLGGIEETLTHMDFPWAHWTRIRTNNGIGRIMLEIRRRTRVVGAFPDGNSAPMLVCARLRHGSASSCGETRTCVWTSSTNPVWLKSCPDNLWK